MLPIIWTKPPNYEEFSYGQIFLRIKTPSDSRLLRWSWRLQKISPEVGLNVYRHYGFEGLERKRNKRTYSREFKLNVVEYYLSKDISYREAANQLDIDAPPILTAWVLKYNKHGTNAFRNNERRQAIKTMPKAKPSKIESQCIRELEIQLRRAQVEIDCLKELRRLREIKQIKKKLK